MNPFVTPAFSRYTKEKTNGSSKDMSNATCLPIYIILSSMHHTVCTYRLARNLLSYYIATHMPIFIYSRQTVTSCAAWEEKVPLIHLRILTYYWVPMKSWCYVCCVHTHQATRLWCIACNQTDMYKWEKGRKICILVFCEPYSFVVFCEPYSFVVFPEVLFHLFIQFPFCTKWV